MALTRDVLANRAKQVRKDASGADKQGSGDDRHMLIGPVGSGGTEQRYRSLVNFNWTTAWTDVAQLVKAEMFLRVEDDSTHFTLGTRPRIRVQRATQTWSDGTGGENVWSSGDYQAVASTGGIEKDLAINPATGKPQDDTWLIIDITSLVKACAPKSVLMPSGAAGEGLPNHGYVIRAPGTETDNAQRAIFHSWHATTPGNRPFVRLTYDPVNRKPVAPTLTGPGTTNVTFAESLEGVHSDPDGDPMAGKLIEVYLKGGSTNQWLMPNALQSAGSEETANGRFSVPLSLAAGSLKLGTEYEWVAKTKDSRGLWGPFSARRALRITSSAPTIVATPYTETASMAGVTFGGTFTDPEGNQVDMFHLQMRRLSAHTDAAFADTSELVWDTGETLATAGEAAARVIRRDYGGSPLAAGDFTYRIRARDTSGVWSPWAYDDFKLTAGFDPDPGSTDLTTQVARNAPIRIAFYTMGTLRGRGALIGYLDDPIDLGHSVYMNNGGELYFSLPALHPYCPSIEPHRTHYSVEQYYGDRYRELPGFQGIITDFDADADSVIFYGTDYLGLLQTAVDERYNPAKVEEVAPTGSKYVDRTIDYVIRDQLTYHKNLPNSPVGFIGIGTLTALAERVTIYSTYSEALPFIGGLIASHKQGTGREARLYVKPSADYSTWAWTLTDNWGRDRPNIRLEYGGLLNDFRVVALGDFGTRVLAVGQKRGEVKVYRAVGTSGLDEAQWGRRAKSRFYQDINDQNDLNRRAKEDAMVLSKVGKRMALAIRADMLTPFDGWDVGDNIIVDIERGVVDTSEYGSGGYWTIIGLEWRYYPDGHTDMVLTILPKKTNTPPDPDLIPSLSPGVPLHWQVGYGVPKKFGEPPYNTPTTLTLRNGEIVTLTDPPAPPVQAQFYEDLNTGCVYEFVEQSEDPEVDDYTLVSCPDDDGGEPYVPDTTPTDTPVWSDPALSTGSRLAEDGTVVLFIRADWLPLTAGPPNDDFDHFEVLIRPTVIGEPKAWTLAQTTGGTFPVGKYEVLVTASGKGDGVTAAGETMGQTQFVDITETGYGLVVGNLLAGLPEGATTPVNVYVSTGPGATTLRRAATVSGATATVLAPPVIGDPAPPTASSALWDALNTMVVTLTDDYTHFVNDANRVYGFAVISVDHAGNRAGGTDWRTIQSARDTEGPDIPSGVRGTNGNKLVGVVWQPVYTDDLSRYEVRWKFAPGETPETVDWNDYEWEYGYALTNSFAIRLDDQTRPSFYGEVIGNVRAVDRSGNVTVTNGPPPVYGLESDPGIGWSAEFGAVSSKTLPEELALSDLWAELATIAQLSADQITSGDITISEDNDSPGSIIIRLNDGDSAAVPPKEPTIVGRWDPSGWYVIDRDNLTHAIRATDAKISFTNSGVPDQVAWLWPEEVWTTAISAAGISADYITTGSAQGGHNRVLNSGFELTPLAGPATTIIYDTSGEWDAGQVGSATNKATGSGVLAQANYGAP